MSLSPSETLHRATLRACKAHVLAHGWKGKRRDSAAHSFALGALGFAMAVADASAKELHGLSSLNGETYDAVNLAILVDLIRQRGYRELLAQLHVLENSK